MTLSPQAVCLKGRRNSRSMSDPGASSPRASAVSDSIRLTFEMRDSLNARALRDTTEAGRARLDSLRRERSTVTYGAHPPDTEDESTPLASDAVAGAERDALVREAMTTLAPEQLEVVQRSFFDEQPHSEIAAALNLPIGTVKSRLRLAMAKLRVRLGDLA